MEKEEKRNILKSITAYIEKVFSSEVVEEMISYEVIYEPDTIDLQGHWMTKEAIVKACEDFNTNQPPPNLYHMSDSEKFTIVDTWVQKEIDVVVEGTSQPIKAGTWIAKLQYHDKDLWEMKKAGIVQGVSLGGYGELNSETGEITNLTFEEQE